MAYQPGFGLYLMGMAGRPRPAFFYGYLVFWIHLLGGAALLTAGSSAAAAPGLVALASLCAGLAVYGLLARRFEHLACLAAYGLALHALDNPDGAARLSLGAALIALGCFHSFMVTEYGRFRLQVHGAAASAPTWVTGIAAFLAAVLFVLGLLI